MVDQFDKRSANNSHFTLIRCIVAISLADGEIQPDEKTYIENMLKRLDLTPAQKEILRNDMETRQDPLQLYELIEDPAFKAQVPYFLQLAAWKDNELSTEEQKQILALREKLASESAGFDAEDRKSVV